MPFKKLCMRGSDAVFSPPALAPTLITKQRPVSLYGVLIMLRFIFPGSFIVSVMNRGAGTTFC